MLKQLAALVVAVAIFVLFVRTLSFGESPPVRARPAPSAAPASPAPDASGGVTAMPTPDPHTLAITVGHDSMTVRPRSARREAGLLGVHLENRASYMIELVFVRDAATRRQARRTIVALGTGEQRGDRLDLAAGRYSVVARPLTEGNARPAPAIASAALRIR